MEQNKLLKLSEAAPLLGLKKKTLYNQISEKKFPVPFIKLPGGGIRIKPSEIEKYLDKRTIKQVA